MSDLSQLLGDLYADDNPPKAPAWSSDEALDGVFSTWVPGQQECAPAAEREIVAGVATAPSTWDLDEEHATALAPKPGLALEPEVAAAAVAVITRTWDPRDDDILPVRRAKRGRGR